MVFAAIVDVERVIILANNVIRCGRECHCGLSFIVLNGQIVISVLRDHRISAAVTHHPCWWLRATTIFGVNVIEYQADYEFLCNFVPRVSKFVDHLHHSILIVTEENPAERRSTLYT